MGYVPTMSCQVLCISGSLLWSYSHLELSGCVSEFLTRFGSSLNDEVCAIVPSPTAHRHSEDVPSVISVQSVTPRCRKSHRFLRVQSFATNLLEYCSALHSCTAHTELCIDGSSVGLNAAMRSSRTLALYLRIDVRYPHAIPAGNGELKIQHDGRSKL